MWFLGVVAIALWVGVVLLVRDWSHHLPDPRPPAQAPDDQQADHPPPEPPSFSERVAAWRPGADRATAALAGAVLLTLIGIGGGRGLVWLFLPKTSDDPGHERAGQALRIRRPDGTELHVEVAGNRDGPTVVLTHGWGLNATAWVYLRRRLGDRYRLVTWDLPGLGRSTQPASKDYSLDKLAGDLGAVLDAVGDGPAVLVGHSIGGMITLTYATRHPDDTRVAGLVLAHTTHTNPLRTIQHAGLYTAIQKPVVEPLCYLMIGLAPLVWVSNALSYLNGSQHLSNYRQAFSWAGTWGQVEFVTRYVLQVWPAVYARGLLGMFRTYRVTDELGKVTVPTLVVAGDRDKICRPEASRDIQAGVPGAELVTLSPAGHVGLISSHEAFGRAVGTFLDRYLSTPARRLAETVG
jgi:pimeloyl-ACP methyl ester carboxylesterase